MKFYVYKKSKNLGQYQNNLKNLLVKDYEYSPELAEKFK